MVTVLIELHAAAPYIRSEYEAESSRVESTLTQRQSTTSNKTYLVCIQLHRCLCLFNVYPDTLACCTSQWKLADCGSERLW